MRRVAAKTFKSATEAAASQKWKIIYLQVLSVVVLA